MRKIVYILFALFFTLSCSVSRRINTDNTSAATFNCQTSVYERIVSHNLTAASFFVEKAEFRIKTEEGEKVGLGSIKFCMPDKFLVSIKSHSGIEVARIVLTVDSIMINDRINRKLLYGSTSFLKSKYGLTTAILPVILGDYVNDEILDSTMIRCRDGVLNVDGRVKNIEIKYQINCEKAKSFLTLLSDSLNDNGLQIRYDEFFKVNNVDIPGKIEISDKKSNTKIEIKIKKIVVPWEGTIEFIPGKQYDKIHLL